MADGLSLLGQVWQKTFEKPSKDRVTRVGTILA